MPKFDPFVLFQVLWHHARIQSLHFSSGSPALRSDLIPSFCFRFSGIMPGFDPLVCLGFSSIVSGFDPFVLFQVLWHRARIQSLLFVSGSPVTCPDLAHLLWHCARISLSFQALCPDFHIFIGIMSGSLILPGIVLGFCYLFKNRVWIPLLLRHRARSSLSFPASCLDFPIFTGIVFGFPYLHRYHVRITHLLTH